LKRDARGALVHICAADFRAVGLRFPLIFHPNLRVARGICAVGRKISSVRRISCVNVSVRREPRVFGHRHTPGRSALRAVTELGFARIRSQISTDALVELLHGRMIHDDVAVWRIDVYSIVDANDYRWIQLGIEGPEHRTLLLQLAPFADDGDAIAAIGQWMRTSSLSHAGLLTVRPSN